MNASEMPSGRTPLFYASSKAMVDLLVASGADINHRDTKGRTALHKAAEDALVDVAQVLISKGADVNCRDYESWTPLHYAIQWHGGRFMVGVLLFFGADSRIVNRFGMTPRDLAASWDYRPVVPIPESLMQ